MTTQPVPSSRRQPTLKDIARSEVSRSKWRGVTHHELMRHPAFGAGHGSASGTLSKLDEDGVIVRLAEERNGASVYVLPMPSYVRNRTVIPHLSKRRPKIVATEGCACPTCHALRER